MTARACVSSFNASETTLIASITTRYRDRGYYNVYICTCRLCDALEEDTSMRHA